MSLLLLTAWCLFIIFLSNDLATLILQNGDFILIAPGNYFLQGDKPFVQKLFKPVAESGVTRTLHDLLQDTVPHIFQAQGNRLIISQLRELIR